MSSYIRNTLSDIFCLFILCPKLTVLLVIPIHSFPLYSVSCVVSNLKEKTSYPNTVMKVKKACSYKWSADFPECPRCGSTMERDFQRFCDRCGQRLNWSQFDECEVKYIGWGGVEGD